MASAVTSGSSGAWKCVATVLSVSVLSVSVLSVSSASVPTMKGAAAGCPSSRGAVSPVQSAGAVTVTGS